MLMRAITLVLCLAAGAFAEVKMQPIDYQVGNTALRGYLAYDDSAQGKRPGVVIYPEWWGVTEYPRTRARELAKLGYVAFVADIYGKDVTTSDPKEAAKLAGPFYQDRNLFRERALAGMEELKLQPQVDPTKIAAIGYCFGGSAALEVARGGTRFAGLVSFHGGLSTPNPDADQPITPKILICTGADDAFVPMSDVEAFAQEMRNAHADYQINIYANAHHAFTNPDAGKFGIPNIAYNAEADHRSWEAMKSFFDEIFGEGK